MCKPWEVVDGSAASSSFTGCSLSQCFARATKFSVKCLSSRSLQSKFYLKSKEAELVGKPTVMALTAAPTAMQCGLSRGQATAIDISKFLLCNPNFNPCPLLTSINHILSVDTQSQGLWIHVSFYWASLRFSGIQGDVYAFIVLVVPRLLGVICQLSVICCK